MFFFTSFLRQSILAHFLIGSAQDTCCCLLVHISFVDSIFYFFLALVQFLTDHFFFGLSALFLTVQFHSFRSFSVHSYVVCRARNFCRPCFIIIYFLFCCHHCAAILREKKITTKYISFVSIIFFRTPNNTKIRMEISLSFISISS